MDKMHVPTNTLGIPAQHLTLACVPLSNYAYETVVTHVNSNSNANRAGYIPVYDTVPF